VQVCLTALVSGQSSFQDIEPPNILEYIQQSERFSATNRKFSSQKAVDAAASFIEEASMSDNQDELVHELEEGEDEADVASDGTPARNNPALHPRLSRASRLPNQQSLEHVYSQSSVRWDHSATLQSQQQDFCDAPNIEVTPLSQVPFTRIISFLGRISLHFIKETHLIFESHSGMNGMPGFTSYFMQEMLAVVRAHAQALGGNAVVSFAMDQFLCTDSMSQGYALVSISGDVIRCTQLS
jgi:uncharacterized protein YbjQ (UPF0145 family)